MFVSITFTELLNQSNSELARQTFDDAYRAINAETTEVIPFGDPRQRKGHDVIIERRGLSFSVDEKWVTARKQKHDFPLELSHRSASGTEQPGFLGDERWNPHMLAYGMSWKDNSKVYIFSAPRLKRVFASRSLFDWETLGTGFSKTTEEAGLSWSTSAVYIPINPLLAPALVCTIADGAVIVPTDVSRTIHRHRNDGFHSCAA